jgi:hypothetical protein
LRAVASKSPVVLSAAASSSMTSRRAVVRQVFVQNHRPLGSQKAQRDDKAPAHPAHVPGVPRVIVVFIGVTPERCVNGVGDRLRVAERTVPVARGWPDRYGACRTAVVAKADPRGGAWRS